MSDFKSVFTSLLPILPIIIPLALHFILVCFVLLYNWLPITYHFSHLFFFIVGLWACHSKTEVLPAIAFIVVVPISGLMDIIQLGVYFDVFHATNGHGDDSFQRTWQFSAGMCIINLLFKPVTVLLGFLSVYFRLGGSIGGLGTGSTERDYSTLHGSDTTPSPRAA